MHVQQRDRYDRLLAYVWLPDGSMLNERLLREGWAVLLTAPPDMRYVHRLAPPPALDCRDIPYRRFQMLLGYPHRFDGDADGIRCER